MVECWAVLWASAEVAAYLPFCFVEMNRPAGEHIDYTKDHLPENSPEFPKNAEARPASFVARIAFSSLEIRSWLR